VNYIIQEADCDFHAVRKEMQQNYIRILEDQYSPRINLVKAPLFPHEIKGVERIQKISEVLFREH
jgi:anion-transporting  ArsA/GET3 family ATPase